MWWTTAFIKHAKIIGQGCVKSLDHELSVLMKIHVEILLSFGLEITKRLIIFSG